MLIHILKIIKNNLRANLLLVAGIFVIATSLWYAVDYVYAVAVNGQKSLGFEWENVYYIQVGVLPQESLERDTTTRSPEMMTGEYLDFCNRLKRHPAVKDLFIMCGRMGLRLFFMILCRQVLIRAWSAPVISLCLE